MCKYWSRFAGEKDRNVSTKVGLFESKKITGEVATGTVHALSAGYVSANKFHFNVIVLGFF